MFNSLWNYLFKPKYIVFVYMKSGNNLKITNVKDFDIKFNESGAFKNIKFLLNKPSFGPFFDISQVEFITVKKV